MAVRVDVLQPDERLFPVDLETAVDQGVAEVTLQVMHRRFRHLGLATRVTEGLELDGDCLRERAQPRIVRCHQNVDIQLAQNHRVS